MKDFVRIMKALSEPIGEYPEDFAAQELMRLPDSGNP